MKKIILCLSLLLLPTSAFASTKTDFLKIVENTFSQDFSFSGGSTFSAELNKKNVLNASTEDSVFRKDSNWEGHRDILINFDLQPIVQFFDDEAIPDIEGEVTVGGDFYYQKDESLFQTRLRDLALTVTATDSKISDISEGFFEFFKLFEGKYMVMDFDEIIDIFSFGNSEEVRFIKSEFEYIKYSLDSPNEIMVGFLKILLDSGFLQISKTNSQYIVSLQDDPKKIFPEKLVELFAYLDFSDYMIEAIKTSLVNETENIRKSWGRVKDMFDVELRFSYSQGRITFLMADVELSLEQVIPEWDYETYEVISEKTMLLEFSFGSQFLVRDDADRIVFPKDEPLIDFSKVMRGFGAMMQL